MHWRATEHYLEEEVDDLLNQPGAARFLDSVALDGVWYWDLERPTEQWFSPGFWKMLGYPGGLDVNDPSTWERILTREDHDRLFSNIKLHCEDPRVPFDQVVRARSATGQTLTLRCRGMAIRREGRPVRLLGVQTVLHDTKEHDLDRQLSELIELSGDAVLAWSLGEGVQRWNAGAEELFGVPASEAIGRDPNVMTEAVFPEPWAEISAKLAEGEHWSGEVERRSVSGRKIYTSAKLSPIALPDGDILILEIDRDVTAEREARENLRDHNRELNHRVKNLFAIVQGLIELSGTDDSDPVLLMRKIKARISALASAHLVSIDQEEVEAVSFNALLDAVLAPYDQRHGQLTTNGARIGLSKRNITPIGMIFHELATNAVKYGGWSCSSGYVSIDWEETSGGDGKRNLEIVWRESGCVAGDPDGREVSGMGLSLMKQSARQLGGGLDWSWRADGMEARLQFPLEDLPSGKDRHR